MAILNLLLLFCLEILIRTASAACTVVNGPRYFDFAQGTCNSDPSNPANLLIYFAPADAWDEDTIFNAQVVYRDANNVQQRINGFPQTVFKKDASNTVTMSFDVPLSAIPAGATVTQRATLTGPGSACTWFGTGFYTQRHDSTAITTDFTTKVTATEVHMTTSTSTLTSTDTSTSTPPEVTATSVTGYRTVYAKKVTSTKTTTITPKPFTKYSFSVAKTTTTVTCLGGQQRRSLNKRREGALALMERQAKTYEMPTCGFWTTNTVYTSTIVNSVTTTTTDTSVTYTTSTTTVTTEAPTPTSYTSVRGTTTVTPTRTVTRWSILRPSVVTNTKVYTVTVTKFPGGKIPKKCTATKPSHGSAICTPTTI